MATLHLILSGLPEGQESQEKLFFFMVKKHQSQTLPLAKINIFWESECVTLYEFLSAPLIFNFNYPKNKKLLKKTLGDFHFEITHKTKI